MKRTDHIPALDGLRGFAALMVVLAHLPKVGLAASPPPLSGALGVMLFFILSGFLMGHLYLWKPFDRPSAIRYMAARVARIFPLYYLVVIACFVLTHVIGKAWAFRLTTNEFVRLLLMGGSKYVFWSIPPEVQFYFVFLGIWFLAQSHALLARWFPVLALAVATIFFLKPVFPGITIAGQLQIFMTGIVVALVHRVIGERIGRGAATFVQIVGLAAIGLTLARVLPVMPLIPSIGKVTNDSAYASVPLALMVGSVMLAYTIDTPFAREVFANPVAERLGAFSFGIYLTHWPVMRAVHDLIAPATANERLAAGAGGVAVTIAIAAALHYAWEMPMQKLLRPRIAQLLDRLTRRWAVPETGEGSFPPVMKEHP